MRTVSAIPVGVGALDDPFYCGYGPPRTPVPTGLCAVRLLCVKVGSSRAPTPTGLQKIVP